MKFVVYEIWTRSSIVIAESIEEAYAQNEPEPYEGMALANWHVVPVPTETTLGYPSVRPVIELVGGLNYRQVDNG